ncbi:MAG TPA: hypothetical protein VK206_14460 [Anaerolineales bacterium]|nr:hypothetical protein [Anaerolineales bacterium]
MFATIALSFLAGVVGGNAFPHFVKGITREAYPNVFGGSPVSNLAAGWVGLILAFVIASFVDIKSYPFISAAAAALGTLLIGLFHAGPGAFGRKP